MILCIILLIVLHFTTSYWWWIIVVPFAYSLLRFLPLFKALLIGMVSAGLVWISGAAYHYLTDAAIVSNRVSDLMGLGTSFWLIAITGTVAILCGGVGCLSGALLRKAILNQDSPGQKNLG